MPLHRRTSILALAATILFGAALAEAQDGLSPAQRLDAPGTGTRAAPEPRPQAAPSQTPDPLDVPEPPGSHLGVDGEVRYPIPTPEGTARASEEPSIRIPSRITTRLRALDANLQALGARGGSNVVNAVLSLLTGGLAITLGALKTPNDDAMSIYLYVYGGTAAVRGVLDFVLTPNAQGAAITYQHMPMTSSEEVRERLAYGEAALGGIAEQALLARVLDASLNMAAGVAVVPIYLAQRDFTFSDPLDYFVLIGAGVSIVSGIVTLASSSAAEQRWGAYVQLRERLREERREELAREGRTPSSAEERDAEASVLPAPRDDLRVHAAASPMGAYAGLSLAF